MEKRDLNATRKSLINAAEELLKDCHSPEEVTSRKIAAQAGVNAAMINYCFGSGNS
jgi:Bacterial regulatory proteins, tetR family.